MGYITKKDTAPFRSWYESHYGHVDDISHLFGIASHEKFHMESEGRCTAVAAFFTPLNFFPVSLIKDFLISVFKNIYDTYAETHYDKGVDQGRAIVGKVAETVAWAQNLIQGKVKEVTDWATGKLGDINNYINGTINPAVQAAQAKIQQTVDYVNGSVTTAVNNAQAKAQQVTDYVNSQITPAVNAAQQKLSSLNSQVDTAVSSLNKVIADVNQKAQQITTLNTQAQATLTKINQMLTTVNSHTSQINDLYARLSQTPPNPTDPTKSPIDKLKDLFKGSD